MPHKQDGPASPLFEALPFGGNVSFKALSKAEVSPVMQGSVAAAPRGACTAWGIPFEIKRPLLVKKGPVSVDAGPLKARWLIFLHTSDVEPLEWNEDGFVSATPGQGRLGDFDE